MMSSGVISPDSYWIIALIIMCVWCVVI